MDIIARLESLAAAPKDWLVTITYACGKIRTHRQPREVMAQNFAEREARKIGKRLIERETGRIVIIESVSVTYSPV